MRILVVEDSVEIAKLAALHLKRDGHVVDIAITYDDACASAETFYDWIIVDIVLDSGTSGWTFAKNYSQQHPTTKVIICSAYEEEMEKIKNEFADYFVKGVFSKPVDYKSVMKLINGEKQTDYVDIVKMNIPELKKKVEDLSKKVERHEKVIFVMDTQIGSMKETIEETKDTVVTFVQDHRHDARWIMGVMLGSAGAVLAGVYFLLELFLK